MQKKNVFITTSYTFYKTHTHTHRWFLRVSPVCKTLTINENGRIIETFLSMWVMFSLFLYLSLSRSLSFPFFLFLSFFLSFSLSLSLSLFSSLRCVSRSRKKTTSSWNYTNQAGECDMLAWRGDRKPTADIIPSANVLGILCVASVRERERWLVRRRHIVRGQCPWEGEMVSET